MTHKEVASAYFTTTRYIEQRLVLATTIGRGERTINEAEANTVRRIFSEYLVGKLSRTIAMALNSEGVPGSQGSEWEPPTLHDNPKHGTGILSNELYTDRLGWNQLRYFEE